MSLHNIQQKLPVMRDWIERTLAAHRTQARSTASYQFPRLKQYYPSVFLEMSFVVIVPRVPVPPLREFGLPELAAFESGHYAGITYRNTYFVSEAGAYDESLHFHELVHVLQWLYLGTDNFLMTYTKGFLEHGYRDNPLEQMAFEFQDYFERGGAAKDLRALVRQRVALIPKVV